MGSIVVTMFKFEQFKRSNVAYCLGDQEMVHCIIWL
jgi:hypothetical protein